MKEPKEDKTILPVYFGPIPIRVSTDGEEYIPLPSWMYRLSEWVAERQTRGGTGGYFK